MNSFVFYRGPSMIDGAPIVAIATGLDARGSRNEKTGDTVQTWILRADIAPHVAVQSGQDASVCGDCPLRGTVVDGRNLGRSCYVKTFQAPLSVFKTFAAGKYPELSPKEAASLVAGRVVRLGSYGDPAAVPFEVWAALLLKAGSFTGYTHQWRKCDQDFARFCMASCENESDHKHAKANGWRTFRTRLAHEALTAREIVCPASEEAGKKTSCAACKACGGTGAKARVDIAIIAHGASNIAHAYKALRAA